MSMKFLTLDNLTKIVEKFKSIFVKLKSDGLAEIDGLYSPSRDQYFTLGDPENLGIDIPEGKTHKILADQEWVTTKISEAELEGKDVDLTPYLKKAEAETTYLKNNIIELTTDDYGKLNNSLSDSQINILKSGKPAYLVYTYKNGGTSVQYKGLIGGMLTTGSTTTFEYPVLCKGSDFDYLLLSVGSDEKVSVAKKQFKDSINLSNVDNWYTKNENGEPGFFSLPKDFVADEETFEYNATIATRDWVEAQYVTNSNADATYLKKAEAETTYTSKTDFNNLDETVTNIGEEIDDINNKFADYYNKTESDESFATKDNISNNITGVHFKEFSEGGDDETYKYIGVYFDTVSKPAKPEDRIKIFETASNKEVADTIDNAINDAINS